MKIFSPKSPTDSKDSGKLKKYIFYAFGEISLIMIGILLAIQVNGWNEDRKDRKLEFAYLIDLRDEISQNIARLEKDMKQNETNYDRSKRLLQIFGVDTDTLSADDLSNLLLLTFQSEVQFRPKTGVMDEIINAGRLGVFENIELRRKITSWSKLMLVVRFQEQEHAKFRFNLMDIAIDHSNTVDPLYARFTDDLGEINFDLVKGDFTEIDSSAFGNNLMLFYASGVYLNGRNYYGYAKREMEEMLSIIEDEILLRQ